MTLECFVAIFAGIFGLMVGSFLNVCIVRLPANLSVVRPRSRCPRCEQSIAWYDNIPVLSWLILRGKCRGCGLPISPMYPGVELLTGAIWALMAWCYPLDLEALRGALFFTLLLGIALTDVREYIIPNEFSLGGLAIGVLFGLVGGITTLLPALIGAATGFGVLWLVGEGGRLVLKKEAMGGGDVKMMAMVGAFVGWQGVLLTIFLGALAGTIIYLPRSLLGSKKDIPFGVFLSLGSHDLDRGLSHYRMVSQLHRALGATALAAALLASCRGDAPGTVGDPIGRLVDSLRPAVERTVGLPFKSPPRFAVRTRAQVTAYLGAKLEEELPPDRLTAMHDVYRLLGQVPDSLDIRRLLTALYEEQVAGFFDPDSGMLFVFEGSDVKSAEFKFVLAHELVHALQYDYLALDSIMHQRRDSDRLSAAQAMLEGQATLASMQMMTPGQDLLNDDAAWEMFREQLAGARASMGVFAETPRVLQEGLIFPYLEGAEFVRWYERDSALAGPPYGAAVPVSTEQVLHPQRYARRDMPLDIPLDTVGAGPGQTDVMGEMGLAILGADLAGVEAVSTTVPIGWAGDRYRLYPTIDGPALVWLIAWDDQRAADRFMAGSGARLSALDRSGYRTSVTPLDLLRHPGTRVVIAPVGWAGWTTLP